MHPYTYTASLRARHPTLRLDFLTELLNLPAQTSWSEGEARQTRAGKALEGTRSESYWVARLVDGWVPSEEVTLEDAVENWLDKLTPRTARLDDFLASGGSLSFFIGLVGKRNFGLEFPPELLSRLASQRIELQFDIYPGE